MASSSSSSSLSILCSLFLALFFCLEDTFLVRIRASQEDGFVFPVVKDPFTLQYVARASHGGSLEPIKLVVDLNGPSVWMDCNSGHVAAASRRLVPSCSIQCAKAKAFDLGSKSGCSLNDGCDVPLLNSITGLATRGQLMEEIVADDSADGLVVDRIGTVDSFLFSCAPSFLLQGLVTGAMGMLGLGRASISLPSQLSSVAVGHKTKFFLCLSPSSNGGVSSGNGRGIFGPKITRSLDYTPLITRKGGTANTQDYFINVNSIKIGGRRLSIEKSRLLVDEEGRGGTKLSTTSPYTTMESSIYDTFVKAYAKAAAVMNMTRVAAVAPFGLCFSSEGVGESILGPNVPEIDLILQSEMVKWKIYGGNSMVKVSREVMCLGVIDGGLEQRASIVIGGLQLEENLLEFDVGASMLGFSSSLLMRETSCSEFMLNLKKSDA